MAHAAVLAAVRIVRRVEVAVIPPVEAADILAEVEAITRSREC